MTPEQVAIVAESVEAIRPQMRHFAEAFYGRLFQVAPETRSMFRGDMDAQTVKFARELDEIVTVIPSFGDFVDRTASLGARHAGYGVRAAHYDAMRDVLIDTLDEALGDGFSDELRDAWIAAFALVSESMLVGAAGRRGSAAGATR
jgi:hemoglobin-like flavoprotein